jgi:hypothetical protein
MDINVGRVFKWAFTPIVNSVFVVCTSVFLLYIGIEKLIHVYRGRKYDKELDELIRNNFNEPTEKDAI